VLDSKNIPTGRYGHKCDTLVVKYLNQLYVFGGITANGDSDELFSFDPTLRTWTMIPTKFPGALWPLARSYHEVGALQMRVTSDHVRYINDYTDLNTGIFSLVDFLADRYHLTTVGCMMSHVLCVCALVFVFVVICSCHAAPAACLLIR
jgi:hypothetical protein